MLQATVYNSSSHRDSLNSTSGNPGESESLDEILKNQKQIMGPTL